MSKTTRCGDFPECDSCINREFDPFQCEDCDDASNYEPAGDEDDSQDMTLDEFRRTFFMEAA